MTTSTKPPPAPPEPLSAGELAAGLTQPLRAIEVVMVDGRTFVATISDRTRVSTLIAVLAAVSFVFTIPYAIVEAGAVWDIALLFVGSMAICLPSLHVFSRYVGLRITLAQNLALALAMTAVAACFTLAFAPILWFLQVTMGQGSTAITPHGISILLPDIMM